MKMIELHNGEYSEGKHGFTMKMNAFGDMVSVMWYKLSGPSVFFLQNYLTSLTFVCLSWKTNEEFRQLVNGYKHQRHRKGKVFQEPLMLQIPKSVDWREKGCVTPVKDQV